MSVTNKNESKIILILQPFIKIYVFFFKFFKIKLLFCLKLLILPDLFRFSFRLFHKEGPEYNKDFSPMFVLHQGIFNFWKEEHVWIAVSSVGKNNSSK